MRYLKTYQLFESKTAGLTKRQEEFLNKYTKGTWTYNSSTGLVDVDGDFDCRYQGLRGFKGVRFGEVGGDFDCEGNRLTSLKGAPQEVGGDFDCEGNQLTTLEGAPQEVGGSLYCRNNQLTTLEGAPQEVGGNFNCGINQLTTLEGAPQEVGGSFYCDTNHLTSLEGAPQEVGGNFDCDINQLTTLEKAPQEVGGDFSCSGNPLTTLKGAPQEVGGSFSCDAFTLESGEWNLEGWLSVLKEGSSKAQKLILTLMSTELLNKQIKQDPAGMIIKLKEVWNDESFREIRSKLVWPRGYEEEADLVGDLDDIGF
jgi:hypothetical protein